MRKRIQIVLLFVIGLLIGGIFTEALSERTDEYYRKVRENLELFRDVYREISTRYVDDIDPEEFIRAGIRGMLDTLDPYTVFIGEDGVEDLQIMTTGQYGGIGTVIGVSGEDKILTVISPIEGTPAERLGIRAGDEILFIDSVSTAGFSTEDAAKLMRGEPGTEVILKIRRLGMGELLEYTIRREIINVKDVSTVTRLEGDVGYVRLARFSRKAGLELGVALEELKNQGMKSLILDLRGNPGGLLESAVDVTDWFLPKGETIVSTRGMIPESNRIIQSSGNTRCPDCPLVVLVDGGSASASEIVAGAIQDLDRGVIIGERTFGKGLVQSLVSFRNGTELKLTTAKYFTPSGRLIQKVDYFAKDNPVLLRDTTVEEGKAESGVSLTRGGREVHGGGGIEPDVEIPHQEVSSLTAAIFRQSMIFQFVNEYITQAEAEAGLQDPELAEKFQTFLEKQNFDYKTDGEVELEVLEKIAEEKNLNSEFKHNLAELRRMENEIKKIDFAEQKGSLERYIRMEFAYRISGAEGRLIESVPGDEQLKSALNLLRDKQAYDSILSSAAPMKTGQ